jgi:hypothetical protein
VVLCTTLCLFLFLLSSGAFGCHNFWSPFPGRTRLGPKTTPDESQEQGAEDLAVRVPRALAGARILRGLARDWCPPPRGAGWAARFGDAGEETPTLVLLLCTCFQADARVSHEAETAYLTLYGLLDCPTPGVGDF